MHPPKDTKLLRENPKFSRQIDVSPITDTWQILQGQRNFSASGASRQVPDLPRVRNNLPNELYVPLFDSSTLVSKYTYISPAIFSFSFARVI